ncbi:hypothetical protein AZ20_4335 [Bordetella bronchiseptica E014]|nr:hypothetical protein L572_4390 [Bordetella bronchiseptica 345]KDC13910.1 hypothetical protein AZ20_4335 [Bordetella bronchiseptica E014]KDC38854.1 hypothetical protein L506_4380 [Bordetella bronchiseptica GA96-01]KDC99590.1 hypothetical protein L518_3978 [Bordetella bronchiseptica MBORD675]KDD84887.1 hypothetical protein L531_4068 [Bordetella bronchiseptica MO275]
MARDRGFSTRRGGRPRRLAHLRCNRLWLDLAPMRYCRQYYDWRRPWQISLASPGWLAARRGTSPAPVLSREVPVPAGTGTRAQEPPHAAPAVRACLSPPGQARCRTPKKSPAACGQRGVCGAGTAGAISCPCLP